MSETKTGLDIVNDKMKDTNAKVSAANESVQQIRQAVRDMGVGVTAETTLAELPDKIREICIMTTTESSPVGEIIAFMGNKVPAHYLLCDGDTYPIGSYPLLEKFFVDQFGVVNAFGGDGSSTFAVPDLRGEFLRGSGTNSHSNTALGAAEGSGASVGEHQEATVTTPIGVACENATCISVASNVQLWEGASNSDSASPSVSGHAYFSNAGTNDGVRNELITSRPTNTSVLYCIKYEPTVVVVDSGEDPDLTDTDIDAIVRFILAPKSEDGTDDALTDEDLAGLVTYILAPANTTESEVETI